MHHTKRLLPCNLTLISSSTTLLLFPSMDYAFGKEIRFGIDFLRYQFHLSETKVHHVICQCQQFNSWDICNSFLSGAMKYILCFLFRVKLHFFYALQLKFSSLNIWDWMMHTGRHCFLVDRSNFQSVKVFLSLISCSCIRTLFSSF